MDTIRFEPAIGSDLQTGQRRQNAGHQPTEDLFADLLGDQLKRRAEAERRELGLKRRELSAHRRQDSDALSGRPARIVLAHARTLRGEAQEIIGPADAHISGQAKRPLEDGCEQRSGAETVCTEPATSEAPIADRPAETPDDKEQTSDPLATVAVFVQPAAETLENVVEISAETAVGLVAPVPAESQDDLPARERSDHEANGETSGSSSTMTEANLEPQVVTATFAADLSAVVATLETAGITAPAETGVPGTPQQRPSLGPTALAEPQPAVELPEAETAIADLIPPPARPERPAAEFKPRPGPAARPNPGEPAASPTPTNGSQVPVHPRLASGLQAGAQAGLGGSDEFSGASLSGDLSGPGWALHLAQGAAGKRAEFVAQLKQHLQNLPAHEQVAVHIQRALREGTSKFSVQLSPAELGRIQVRLEIDEDKRVTAAVSVERPSTLELLQRDVKGLERALHDAGLKMDGGNLSFSLSHSGDQKWAQEQTQFGTAGQGGGRAEPLSEGDQPNAGSGDVLDTAAGVVNLRI